MKGRRAKMSKHVRLLTDVTWNGGTVAAGDTIEVNDESAAALIRDGAAEDIETAADPAGTPGQANPPADPAGTPGENTTDIKKITTALDAHYKKDELILAAKEAGVEFPFDATKGVIIEAVIAAGKADLLLK